MTRYRDIFWTSFTAQFSPAAVVANLLEFSVLLIAFYMGKLDGTAPAFIVVVGIGMVVYSIAGTIRRIWAPNSL